MNDLVSIIVPIYNIDRYIGLCIESILNQTYRKIDIVLVDDGSPDRCRELCDLYARKDPRIRVIHKPNGGLVSARKSGLREARGSYVTYVDGDDWIDSDYIEILYTSAKETNADVVCAGFTRDLFSKSVSLLNTISAGFYEGEELRNLQSSMLSKAPFYRPGITTYVWNKLFKREVLLEPQFLVDDRITIGEDAAVTYPALLKSKRVSVIDNTSYHYRQREDSMLKQSAKYSKEAQHLNYLHQYMMKWANKNTAFQVSSQVEDYVLANAIMRSGGKLSQDNYSVFGNDYFGKSVVIYSAGTFGQQLVNRIRESKVCRLAGWIDDDYWEYRRCCLDVDPVESIGMLSFDYLLIAKVDGIEIERIKDRLNSLGVPRTKILTVAVPEDKKQLIKKFLDVEAIKLAEMKYEREVISHA